MNNVLTAVTPQATSSEARIQNVIARSFAEIRPEITASLRENFAREGFMKVDAFGTPELQAMLRSEMDYLLEVFSTRRDITIAATGNTPRNFRTVSQAMIKENGRVIPLFFHHEGLMDFLRTVTQQEKVYRVPYEPEEFIITNQRETGDTHGWHWDDYSLAMVWIAKSPGPNEGGLLEFVPHTEWNKDNPRIQEILTEREVRRVYLAPGSLYLLKADTALHRVAPLKSGERAAVVFTFALESDMHREISHVTMEQIFEIPSDDKR